MEKVKNSLINGKLLVLKVLLVNYNKNLIIKAALYGHTAVLYEDHMYVYGGRISPI